MKVYITFSKLIKKLTFWYKVNISNKYDDLFEVELQYSNIIKRRVIHRECLEKEQKNPAILSIKILEYRQYFSACLDPSAEKACFVCGFDSFPIEYAVKSAFYAKKRAIEDYRWTKNVSFLFKKMLNTPPKKLYITSWTDFNPCKTFITKKTEDCTCGSYSTWHWDGRPQWEDVIFKFDLDWFDTIKYRTKKVEIWVLTVMTLKAYKHENKEDKSDKWDNCFDKTVIVNEKYLAKNNIKKAVKKWLNKNIPQLLTTEIEWEDDYGKI